MKVFLDMDGVLANFHRGAMIVHNMPLDVPYPVECGWDIVNACNKIKPGCNMTAKKFWSGVEGKDFWVSLQKTFLCDKLVDVLRKTVGYERICLLSSCNVRGSADGKMEWVRNNLPKEMHRNCLFGSGAKSFCASPDALLIDDYDLNVNEFREAGGRAVLVPRPWNSDWRHRIVSDITIERVYGEIASLAK